MTHGFQPAPRKRLKARGERINQVNSHNQSFDWSNYLVCGKPKTPTYQPTFGTSVRIFSAYGPARNAPT